MFTASIRTFDPVAATFRLPEGDRARAAAIARPERRSQFILGRRLLATALHACHGASAEAWSLGGGQGALRLIGAGAPWVSIAHSGHLVACAVSDRPVGIDVEAICERDIDALAHHVCSTREWDEYRSLPAALRRSRFYAIWVIKEALFKCLGAADAVGDIRFPAPLSGKCIVPASQGVALALFEPAPGFQGGLAVSGGARVAEIDHRVLVIER